MNYAVSESSETRGEAAQARLLAALACPLTNGPVEVLATALAGGAVRDGAIFNRAGAQVGKIANFQIDFVRVGEAETHEALRRRHQAGELPRRIDHAPEWRLVPHDAPGIAYSLKPLPVDTDEMVALDGEGATISFDASGPIELQLFAHPWSGIVEIGFGEETRTVDLYRPHLAAPHPVALDLGPSPARVQIRLTGAHNECAFGRQCLFGGYRHPTGATVPLRHVKRAKVRGAAFGEEFHRLLDGVPADGILLDVGGGNRQVDDPRYINLDYADFAEPDLIADATRLPLRDASVDAVYSTGVFEHIADPLRAGAEVARVLKPGGRATIGWAFMQPIHSEGHHFYNATPWGVENAFKALKPTRVWCSTSLAFLLRWGAEVSGLAERVPASEIDAVCRTLARWDGLIPESKKAYMANGVWAEFEKPA
jgi:SAM-dependent methyltransferase